MFACLFALVLVLPTDKHAVAGAYTHIQKSNGSMRLCLQGPVVCHAFYAQPPNGRFFMSKMMDVDARRGMSCLHREREESKESEVSGGMLCPIPFPTIIIFIDLRLCCFAISPVDCLLRMESLSF